MEYRPSYPAKNISHKGHKGRSPLVKNKKATFGTRWYGELWTLGAMDAHQNSSSSVMLCMMLFGMKRNAPTCAGKDCVGRGDGGDAVGCRGGGGDDTGSSGNGGNGVGEGIGGTKGR